MNGSHGGDAVKLPRLLLTYPEAAEVLSIGKSTLYALVRRGEIPAVKFGNGKKTGRGNTRFKLTDLEAFVDRKSRKVKSRQLD